MRGFRGVLIETLRRDFGAGLLALVPVVATIAAAMWVIERLDRAVLPKIFGFFGQADQQPPFLGVIVTLAVILLAGALTRSLAGRAALRLFESGIDRVPVLRSVYGLLKQLMHSVFSEGDYGSFKRVVLVEYPRRGVWSYAFVIGYVQQGFAGIPAGTVKVFVPKTPNPTTGYYVLIAPTEVRESGVSVEEAFRIIVSAGTAAPTDAEIAARLEGLRERRPPASTAEREALKDDGFET